MIKFKQVNLFSISDLQKFSGIKAHTIRMWEQRYNALHPERSEGNTRYYNNAQLRRLLNIVSLMNSDYKVSELCSLPDEKLYKLLEEQFSIQDEKETQYSYFISQIVASALNYDEMYFDKLFSGSILRFGIKNTYVHIVYPVLTRIGLWWATNELHPAQEHFISNLFRQKFFAAIDALPPPKISKNSWLLFLPENEFHDTALLFSNFIIRHSGKKVIYLGENVPFDSLKITAHETNISNLLFFLVRKNDREEDRQFISLLSKNFPDKTIHIACDISRMEGLKMPRNCIPLHSATDLEKQLHRLNVIHKS